MDSLQDCVNEYRAQLEKGVIKTAYKGLMEFIMDLRTYLQKKYPDYFVSGSIYFGYMDMTYFSFFPKSLSNRKLKVAIVFIHDQCRFEAWLAGYNKQIQTSYWKLFTKSGWNKYHLVPTTAGVDSILEHVLVANPNFDDLNTLKIQIENAALEFIEDVERFIIDNSNS